MKAGLLRLQDHTKLMSCDKLYRLRLRPNACAPVFLALYLGIPRVRGQIEIPQQEPVARCSAPILELDVAAPTFLDRETTRIDALVAEVQSAITLLQERRAALISPPGAPAQQDQPGSRPYPRLPLFDKPW